MNTRYDVIVVGSGAGGSTIAYELSKKGKKVLIIETGPFINQEHLGNFWHSVVLKGYYDKSVFSLPGRNVKIYRTLNVGGTTVFSCGNMIRISEDKFISLGIDLKDCFLEAEEEICVHPLDKRKIIAGSRAIMVAAQKLGYNMIPMPKGGNYSKNCNLCGNCVIGCGGGAKWDARYYVNRALINGATIFHSTRVKKILFSNNGNVCGVEISSLYTKTRIECELVILSAGALNTPVILQNSGISAGNGLFVDLFNVTYGVTDNLSQLKGASMSTVVEFRDEGFILSPFIDHWSQLFVFCPIKWSVACKFFHSRVVGIMAKIADERVGSVRANGSIYKQPTERDYFKLNKGASIAKEILLEVGAKNIVTTKYIRGAHPGGTAAIGEVVDNNLKVYGCTGLYVCDASVFPVAPGAPPILTIVAMAKWLARNI